MLLLIGLTTDNYGV